jgi:hypothetical protein
MPAAISDIMLLPDAPTSLKEVDVFTHRSYVDVLVHTLSKAKQPLTSDYSAPGASARAASSKTSRAACHAPRLRS